MCYKLAGHPYQLILEQHRTPQKTLMQTMTYAFGKVTKLRNGEHISSRGFSYPLGKTVHDPTATIGSHSHGLHLIPSVEQADQLSTYGSHRLVVLPAPQLWDLPGAISGQPEPRCIHSAGVTTLFCIDCAGLTPADLTQPAFWEGFTETLRARTTKRKARTDDFALCIPRHVVWQHTQERHRTAPTNGERA